MSYGLFDAHCDTLTLSDKIGRNIENGELMVNFKKLSSYNPCAQVFAIFNEGNYTMNDIFRFCEKIRQEARASDVIEFCADARDITKNAKKNLASAMVSIEGIGNTSDFEVGYISLLYRYGVRMMSLTWNQDNFLSGAIKNNKSGLTHAGVLVVSEMIKYNMAVDVSHISDAGFWDITKVDGVRLCASHSNSRSICNNTRNLTDEQFLEIIRLGGVCGINLYPEFINGTKNATIGDVILHIDRFLSLGGEDHIGLGCDFDGIDFTMYDINGCEDLYLLFDEMGKIGYTDELIKKISYGNFMRFFGEN